MARIRFGFVILILSAILVAPIQAISAPYAAMVIDARSGKVLHSRNADTKLHPASLTKMMTLYIAFQAVERGEISLDTMVTVSQKAASEPPSRIGLRAGQRIKFRYLIRAAAVKSANDASTAIAEALSGSEAAFARRMNRTARAMGMNRTTFKNAHGLTESGHVSTARDMTTLGRHVLYDYPEYYNLFSRRTTSVGSTQVANTNRRLLGAYRGADGIKTGYTRAAGYNLVASAERGRERIIATMFGGSSSAQRAAQVSKLLDMGFSRAPTRVAIRKPALPAYEPNTVSSKTVRVVRAVTTSIRPMPRPSREEAPNEEILLAMDDGIDDALSELATPPEQADTPVQIAAIDDKALVSSLLNAEQKPARRPERDIPPLTELAQAEEVQPEETATPASEEQQTLAQALSEPLPRPNQLSLASLTPSEDQSPQIVTRLSTSGGRHWGINIGNYGSRFQADKVLLQTALVEITTLDQALRKVVPAQGGFDANFVGMTEEQAALACRRLSARSISCHTLGPG